MRLWKITPWLLIFTGVVWILTVVRNLYAPDFLSFSHVSHADRAGMAPLQLAAGALCLIAGLGALSKYRRASKSANRNPGAR